MYSFPNLECSNYCSVYNGDENQTCPCLHGILSIAVDMVTNQIIIQKKSETEISHSEHSDRSTVAGPKKGKQPCLFLFCIKATIRLEMVSSV